MKGTLPKQNRSYIKSETGNRVWKYDVTGTSEELEAFKAAQQKVIINDETGNPIHFSVEFFGESIELGINASGGVYTNTEKLDMIKDVMKQVGAEGAKAIAADLVKQLLGNNAPAPVAETVEEEASEELDTF